MSEEKPTDLSMTEEQEKVFESLERAFKKCSKVGLLVWDNYGTITAVNGKKIQKVYPSVGASYEKCDKDFDDEIAKWFTSDCWNGSNADDPLKVELKTDG